MTPPLQLGLATEMMTLAMQARIGGLEAVEVQGLIVRAGELLHRDDPVRRAIEWFGTQHDLVRWDDAGLRELGEEAQRRAMALVHPPPVDAGRADIHG
jgi:hypothetical protein